VNALALDPALRLVLRGALALLLLAAAWHKLRDLGRFQSALAGYGLLPPPAVRAVGRVLPAVEAATALALCVPALGAAPALAAAGLLVAYAVAIAAGLARGRRGIDCGCGGLVGDQRLRPALLARNALLVALALAAALPAGPRALVWMDAPTLAGGVAALALLLAAADLALAHGSVLRGLTEDA
jgi:uncharacterized membrane protein YphA (DoxX/SURF4 family)